MDKSKIAILSTVVNFELYQLTSTYFPKHIQKYVIDGRNGMHGISSIKYMMQKLKDKGIEWLVMADEDVIFYDSNCVFSIIDYMQKNNVTICGTRDGGVIAHRNKNPFVINTFFSIMKFDDVLEIWNKKDMLKHQYLNPNEFDDNLKELTQTFNVNSLYEPYYCFYLWLRRKGKKFLFLDAVMDKDGITNYLKFNGATFLCHTWYARSYGNNKKHTDRINMQLKEQDGKLVDKLFSKPIIFKDKTFYFTKKINKYYKRLLMKFQ
jgi:hypothetical protein